MRDKVIAVKYICASAGELSDKSMCGHASVYFDKQGHRCMAHGNKKCIHKCKKED